MMRYEDFDLVLTREGDRYMAEVRKSPAGPSNKVPLQWPFGNDPHEVLLLKLENAVLKSRGGTRSGLPTPEEKVLREFGSDVFGALFQKSGSVATKFAASLEMVNASPGVGLRLVLRIDPPELSMLPWEYLFDVSARDAEGNYLCLRIRSPLVRFLTSPTSFPPVRVNGPLRILGMIANPGTQEWPLLDTEAERHRIEMSLQKLRQSGEVHLEWVRGGSYDDLFDLLHRDSWHVFHFIGHGGTDRYVTDDGSIRSQGYIVMQDRTGGAVRVSADQLGYMLEDDGTLSLAVLNCCDSGQGSNGFSSAGAALVHSGVPLAVAMQFAITDGAAARFAGAFYGALVGGHCIEAALTKARLSMRLESNVEWGIPVLFTRTGSCVLFELKPSVPAGASQTMPAAPTSPGNRNQARDELRRLLCEPDISREQPHGRH